MASTFFLMKQFEDVLLYLSSVKTYFPNDDAFNFNYAQVSFQHFFVRSHRIIPLSVLSSVRCISLVSCACVEDRRLLLLSGEGCDGRVRRGGGDVPADTEREGAQRLRLPLVAGTLL